MLVPAAVVACSAPFARIPDLARRPIFLAIPVAGMVGPALADVSGVIAPSWIFRDNTVVLVSRMTDLSPSRTFLGILLIHVATLVISTRLFWRIRDAFRDTARSLHVLAWRLRQIVSGTLRGGAAACTHGGRHRRHPSIATFSWRGFAGMACGGHPSFP